VSQKSKKLYQARPHLIRQSDRGVDDQANQIEAAGQVALAGLAGQADQGKSRIPRQNQLYSDRPLSGLVVQAVSCSFRQIQA
jgi:hypothetical protein